VQLWLRHPGRQQASRKPSDCPTPQRTVLPHTSTSSVSHPRHVTQTCDRGIMRGIFPLEPDLYQRLRLHTSSLCPLAHRRTTPVRVMSRVMPNSLGTYGPHPKVGTLLRKVIPVPSHGQVSFGRLPALPDPEVAACRVVVACGVPRRAMARRQGHDNRRRRFPKSSRWSRPGRSPGRSLIGVF
jgi:hypothetical protein